jgi:hypothetical protein
MPSGTTKPERGGVSIGAQFATRDGDGGAVWAGGVTEPGGAWASATPEAAINRHDSNNARFIPMPGKRFAAGEVPRPKRFQEKWFRVA